MRKLFPVFALLMALMLVLSACGGAAAPAAAPAGDDAAAAPAEGDAAAEATVDPNAPTPEPTPVVNTFGACDDPLRLWHGLTGSDGAVFAEMLQQYAEANPEACFESQGIPWDLFFQKYPTAVAAGSPPDLVVFHAAEVQQMAAEGLMEPMDAFYETSGLTKDQFNEALINQISVDGVTMAVPFDNHGWLAWVNTKVIEDAGLDPTTLPANGTDFIPWAQQITTDVNGLHPNEEGFDPDNVAVWATYWTWPRYTVPSILWQFGGAVVNEDVTQATLNSPESTAAVQYIKDLMCTYHVMNPYQTGTPYGGEPYEANQIAVWWEGTWTGGYMRDRPDVAAVTVPMFVNSFAPDGNQAVKFDSHVFSVPTGVDDAGREAAYNMVQYLVENGSYWATSGQVPALKSVQEQAEVQAIPSVAKAAEQFNAIGRTDTASPRFIEIQTAWETAIGNALATCDADVEQALNDGNEAIQAILDRP